jgi:hypothetical protein
MALFKQSELRHSIEIEIKPEKIWEFSPPILLVSPKVEWQIEPKGSTCIFTAISFMRFGRLFLKLLKKHMKESVKLHDKHVRAEGENLKKILENKKNA